MANPNRPQLQIRTPGVPVTQPTEGDDEVQSATDEAATETTAPAAQAAPAPTVTVTVEQLQAMVAAQVGAAMAAAGVRKPAAAPKLPDQTEINPDAIERMTLSQQGWVVPSRMGAVPERLAKQLLGA